MEIRGETYRMVYDETTNTVTFEGMLRLFETTDDYRLIGELLDEIASVAPRPS